MALYRDRRGLTRWSFTDSPTVPVLQQLTETSATCLWTGSESAPTVTTDWRAERREWLAESGSWPTEPGDDSVRLAGMRPERQTAVVEYPGLPVDSPALVRARHGRGFSTRARRRRSKTLHGNPPQHGDVDLDAVDAALDVTETLLGDALVGLVVWQEPTGLPLATRRTDAAAAAAWHRATRDVRSTTSYAELPEPGPYHLVGLADQRLAVLIAVGAALGACITVDLSAVSIADLMGTTVPRLTTALASAGGR